MMVYRRKGFLHRNVSLYSLCCISQITWSEVCCKMLLFQFEKKRNHKIFLIFTKILNPCVSKTKNFNIY